MCLGYITKTYLSYSTYITALVLLFFAIGEFIVMIAAVLITRSSPKEVLENQFCVLVCTSIVKTLEIVILCMLYRTDISKHIEINSLKNKFNVQSLAAVQTFLFVAAIISMGFIPKNADKITLYLILLMSIYLLNISLVFLDFKEKNRAEMIKTRYSLLQEHVKNLDTITSIVRKEKHDFNNHLNTILGLCTLNKEDMAEKIKQYINNITGKSYYSQKSLDTGNDYIDALIAVKKNVSIDNGVQLKLDIQEPLSFACIDDKSLVMVVGNIIDNAFEAFSKVNDKSDKYIYMATYTKHNYYYISIRNNGPEIPDKHLNKIFLEGFSTKINDISSHGYGLYIVSENIKRHNGSINVISTPHETEFLIKLKMNTEFLNKDLNLLENNRDIEEQISI
jgi:signal transduction histidine kinase